MSEVNNDDSLPLRCAILSVPIALTANFLQLKLSKPLAWGIATSGWLLLIYWLPSRSHVRLRKWLIIVAIVTALAVVSSIVWPDMM
jgi:hypothetical protein